ncbi:hypothetical protein [Cardiobacterium hominis]|uniref:Uncharacterized protein n=1 Tax=Cardiobacterium hominis (strain ATCC 15826 / DSM 8339 / NCTC 10426 / 6573) TaxID=638300 RepID=C8N918_CARH6|nr:hypothetical protein [Cardiobacterium hominis]EEV88857.1 hypothetical protein HMPREF0198_0996 [Cardiobacterium hominis ATCC 15826]
MESITVFTENSKKSDAKHYDLPAAGNPLPLAASAGFVHGNSYVKSGVL